MLRKFKISIDGKEYLVEMEEIGGTPQPVLPVQPVVETPAPQTATPAASEAPSVSEAPIAAGADAMPSPMPGTILRILVNVGDTVAENQPLMILAGIHVNQGEMVNPGDPLITIH